MNNPKLRDLLKSITSSSAIERRRILLLIPLLCVIGLLCFWEREPRFEESFMRYSDLVAGEVQGRDGTGTNAGGSGHGTRSASSGKATRLAPFDPNTIDFEGLELLGFSAKQAQTILNYRNAGAKFRKPEDFKKCYTVSPEKYAELLPYIVIGGATSTSHTTEGTPTGTQESAAGQRASSIADTSKKITLIPFDPNTIDLEGFVALGFSPGQAQTILNYRNAGAKFRKPEDFKKCYTVTPEKYAELLPYITIGSPHPTDPTSSSTPNAHSTPSTAGSPSDTVAPRALLNLNTADTASLSALYGIGPLTASRIVSYRQRLGGFVRATQLQEVEGMLERNYLRILPQIFVDSGEIKKIDINFAHPKQLQGHPYLPPRTLNKLLKYRQLKGGWRSTRELIEQHILSTQEAEKLSSYLIFRKP